MTTFKTTLLSTLQAAIAMKNHTIVIEGYHYPVKQLKAFLTTLKRRTEWDAELSSKNIIRVRYKTQNHCTGVLTLNGFKDPMTCTPEEMIIKGIKNGDRVESIRADVKATKWYTMLCVLRSHKDARIIVKNLVDEIIAKEKKV